MRNFTWLPVVVALLASAFTGSAAAHSGGPQNESADARAHKATAQGLQRVRLPGTDLFVHGGDRKGRQESTRRAGKRGQRAVGLSPSGRRRPLACSSAERLEVIFLGPDVMTEEEGRRIRPVLERSNAVINRDALASGGRGADLRVACNERGGIRITQVRSAALVFPDIVTAIRAALPALGAGSDFAVFVDGVTAACGYGSLRVDARPGPENLNNTVPGYAVIYRDCWTGDTPLHEIGHTQGAVQPDAPASTGSGLHCNEELDVMCYRDGGDRSQTLTYPCEFSDRFDCRFNDYFDAAPEPGEYLATHWNLGSAANSSIQLR